MYVTSLFAVLPKDVTMEAIREVETLPRKYKVESEKFGSGLSAQVQGTTRLISGHSGKDTRVHVKESRYSYHSLFKLQIAQRHLSFKDTKVFFYGQTLKKPQLVTSNVKKSPNVRNLYMELKSSSELIRD